MVISVIAGVPTVGGGASVRRMVCVSVKKVRKHSESLENSFTYSMNPGISSFINHFGKETR